MWGSAFWTAAVSLDTVSQCFFFFNDTATTEIYTLHIVGSVRCVQETVSTQSTWGVSANNGKTLENITLISLRLHIAVNCVRVCVCICVYGVSLCVCVCPTPYPNQGGI
eukprot:TRINITY_DN3070_c0_g1_i2.p2 TRINITY_DN3070_c0_g1~~TRINITY_DN3070_c0_g1_i2.p2  ORF type:complete len:109 (-),score=21.50 TRINITY_DN3070_c0_g1_i2:182-508(-)